MKHIACPVALHPDGAPLRLPAIEGATGTLHLICGTVGADEHPERAAALRLIEQSGLETRATLLLGVSDKIEDGMLWHFVLCRVAPPVRSRWQHLGPDGTLQRFEWAALEDPRLTGRDAGLCAWIRGAL